MGVRRTARHVCWAARGELVAAIVEFESEQAGALYLCSHVQSHHPESFFDSQDQSIVLSHLYSLHVLGPVVILQILNVSGGSSRSTTDGLVLAVRGALS